jgi:hypothetical protein
METHVQKELEANAPNGIVKATYADFATYVNDASSTKLLDQIERPKRQSDDWEIAAITFSVGELRNELIKSGKYSKEMCELIKKMPKGNQKDEINCVLNLLVPYWREEKYRNAPPPSKQAESVKENWEKFVDKNNMILNRAKLISIFKDNAKKCEEITAEKLRNKKQIIQFIKENEIENKY